ncbi:AAA family ATPase [Actinocorallia sp. A-T 12471]|uniref:AAA family ATPase n=1 Tax=Actinocorallia sp. A-T 12471 TaxID=3089813 RepID=UPI0029D1C074|nr:AAA family ATPase [Actinocorallia sp. A-T 12471]MDX6740144.1 NB-ARC domain-containing protein [Actinocorallia sp. A-T 12471]
MNEFSGEADKVVQIGTLHGDFVIQRDRPRVPQEIDALTGAFVNREDLLTWLHALLAEPSKAVRIVVLTGLSGVGKSALARRFAEQTRDHFTGGQLLGSCADHATGGLVDVNAMVGSALHALGVAERHQPETLTDKVKMFRSRTADKPCLVLVDGATEAAQVRALVPNAPGSVVVVTAAADLSELDLDGADFHEVKRLDAAHSRLLFTEAAAHHRAGERVAEAAAGLVAYCDGHPLAILVLAGRVRRLHDLTVKDLEEELADERRRLHALTLGGRRVSAAFTTAYERLPAPAQHLYRRLALLPGVDFTLDGAVAVSGAARADARDALALLAEAHLVERVDGGRFRFHALVRAHARELSSGDPAEQREAALHQAVLHRVRWAAFGDRALMGARSRVADHAALLGDAPDPFGAGADAGAWFRAERANLFATVRAAHDAGFHTETWQLAEALVAYYLNYRHLTEWTAVSALGADSARLAGEPRAEARLRIGASRAHMGLRDSARAWAELERAGEIAESSGDPVLEASVWEHRGRVLDVADREAALSAYDRARELNERAGEKRGVALVLFFRAQTLAELGRAAQARTQMEDALARFRALGDRRMAARAAVALAGLLGKDGADEARDLLTEAIDELTGTHYEAGARELLADLTEDSDAALAHLRRAVEIYRAEGDPRGDEVAARLDGSG